MGNLIASKRGSEWGKPYQMTPREEMIDRYGSWVVKYLQDWDRWTGKKYFKRGTFKPKAWENLYLAHHRNHMKKTRYLYGCWSQQIKQRK